MEKPDRFQPEGLEPFHNSAIRDLKIKGSSITAGRYSMLFLNRAGTGGDGEIPSAWLRNFSSGLPRLIKKDLEIFQDLTFHF